MTANDIPGSVYETKLPFVCSHFWRFGVSAAFAVGAGAYHTDIERIGVCLGFGTLGQATLEVALEWKGLEWGN